VDSRYPATIAVQALGWIDESIQELVPLLHLATMFIRDPDDLCMLESLLAHT
jgi:hypothetical protein